MGTADYSVGTNKDSFKPASAKTGATNDDLQRWWKQGLLGSLAMTYFWAQGLEVEKLGKSHHSKILFAKEANEGEFVLKLIPKWGNGHEEAWLRELSILMDARHVNLCTF